MWSSAEARLDGNHVELTVVDGGEWHEIDVGSSVNSFDRVAGIRRASNSVSEFWLDYVFRAHTYEAWLGTGDAAWYNPEKIVCGL